MSNGAVATQLTESMQESGKVHERVTFVREDGDPTSQLLNISYILVKKISTFVKANAMQVT